jgi:choline-sulfatase
VKADPNEWTNLAGEVKHAPVKKDLARWLPKVDKPPVPGSKSRILTYDPATYDPATGEAVWEGTPIDKTAELPRP